MDNQENTVSSMSYTSDDDRVTQAADHIWQAMLVFTDGVGALTVTDWVFALGICITKTMIKGVSQLRSNTVENESIVLADGKK